MSAGEVGERGAFKAATRTRRLTFLSKPSEGQHQHLPCIADDSPRLFRNSTEVYAKPDGDQKPAASGKAASAKSTINTARVRASTPVDEVKMHGLDPEKVTK